MGFILKGLAFIFRIPEAKDIVLECSILFYNYSCRKVEKNNHVIKCSGVMLRPILNRVNPKGGGGGEQNKTKKQKTKRGGGKEEIELLAS